MIKTSQEIRNSLPPAVTEYREHKKSTCKVIKLTIKPIKLTDRKTFSNVLTMPRKYILIGIRTFVKVCQTFNLPLTTEKLTQMSSETS